MTRRTRRGTVAELYSALRDRDLPVFREDARERGWLWREFARLLVGCVR